jgi:peptidoglycan/LPS O-acetylase OafA/YrhL
MSQLAIGSGARLRFLDALRGVAVLAVLVSHSGERVFPLIAHTNLNYFQLGQFGVTLFFLTSGFVIPMTLERGTLRRFWTSRLFRLFPLYLVVLAVLAVLTAVGLWHQSDALTPGQWLLNATMLQGLVAQPHALGVFWSLTWELLFYFVMCGLFLLGLHRRSVTIALVVLTLANVDALTPSLPDGGWYPIWWMFLAQLCTGTVFYRLLNGETTMRRAVAVAAYYVATCVFVTWQYFGSAPPATGGTWAFPAMTTAWVVAIAVFVAAFALRNRTMPRALVWAGTISYSLYLVHLVVMDIGRPLDGPSTVIVDGKTTMALYVVVSLAIAWATYRWIEKPCVDLGRRISRPLPAHRTRHAAAMPVQRTVAAHGRETAVPAPSLTPSGS